LGDLNNKAAPVAIELESQQVDVRAAGSAEVWERAREALGSESGLDGGAKRRLHWLTCHRCWDKAG
jgi:hypothetical protein